MKILTSTNSQFCLQGTVIKKEWLITFKKKRSNFSNTSAKNKSNFLAYTKYSISINFLLCADLFSLRSKMKFE